MSKNRLILTQRRGKMSDEEPVLVALQKLYDAHRATHIGEWDEEKHRETFKRFAEAVFNCWPKLMALMVNREEE